MHKGDIQRKAQIGRRWLESLKSQLPQATNKKQASRRVQSPFGLTQTLSPYKHGGQLEGITYTGTISTQFYIELIKLSEPCGLRRETGKPVRAGKKKFYLRAREASFPSLSWLPSFTLNRKRSTSLSLSVS